MGKKQQNDKKRHHFVPKAYLKAFCNENGRVWVYRKDNPQQPRPESPDSTQFRNYYYSQPRPDGGQDNNALEDFFCTIESGWPETVANLRANKDINDQLSNLFEFMSLQRARVPAARDLTEGIDAQFVKSQLILMQARGELPTPPPGFEDLPNTVEVAIDPHRSIHAMVDMFQGMGALYDVIGLSVVHNKTSRPFLTSDNPVIWFDPSITFEQQLPYTVNLPQGPVALIFPISPHLAIVGDTAFAQSYAKEGLLQAEIDDEELIKAINEQICRFAYESILASAQGQEDLILKHAECSPVLETKEIRGWNGSITVHQQVFGKRHTKPKW
ncbi:DUF4238 domain-containing protein [Pseudomonas sp. GL-RE-26]|uniref:DUF4238 domain-containing protein n=1 Tax=Pseudomonas sp. GL-RE-26 TaxID=2832390 RepID=UPI001CBBE766|nr:DUF4238 domain-containing protein [Pseudomonas sp. GL-RE-26]